MNGLVQPDRHSTSGAIEQRNQRQGDRAEHLEGSFAAGHGRIPKTNGHGGAWTLRGRKGDGPLAHSIGHVGNVEWRPS